MMKVFAVFVHDWRRLVKDFSVIAGLILMPLAFILPVGLSAPGGGGTDAQQREPLIVADYDGGEQARALITELAEHLRIEQQLAGELVSQYQLQDDALCAQAGPACDEAIGRLRVQDATRAALLIIPPGLQRNFEASRQQEVSLFYDPGGNLILIEQIKGIVQGAAIKTVLSKQVMFGKAEMVDLSAIGDAEVRKVVAEMVNQVTPAEQAAALSIKEVSPAGYTAQRKPNLLESVVPGYTVMFVFVFVAYMAGWGSEEKLNGLFRRLRSTPVRKAELLGGKLLFGVLVCLIQILILFAVGRVLGLAFAKDLPAFLLLSVVLAAVAAALGLLAAALNFPGSAITAPLIVGALLGGCFFSTDLLPAFLQPVSYLLPHRWAVTGYQDLLVRGHGLAQVLPEIGALAGFAVLFFALAVWRFDPLD